MTIRAIRGATTLDVDSASQMDERISELYDAMLQQNKVNSDDIVSCIISATKDIHSKFPAQALRETRDIGDVPLMGAAEIDVAGALPLALRILMTVETSRTKNEIKHVYQHQAANLRPDLSEGD